MEYFGPRRDGPVIAGGSVPVLRVTFVSRGVGRQRRGHRCRSGGDGATRTIEKARQIPRPRKKSSTCCWARTAPSSFASARLAAASRSPSCPPSSRPARLGRLEPAADQPCADDGRTLGLGSQRSGEVFAGLPAPEHDHDIFLRFGHHLPPRFFCWPTESDASAGVASRSPPVSSAR